jgi:polysaccharide biosynthesis protein PslH
MKKPDLLFVAQRLPFPPNKGEKIRCFHMIQHFARTYDVHVGTLIDDPADFAHVEAFKTHIASLHVEEIRKPLAYLASLPGYLAGAPISFELFRKPGLSRWVDTICREKNPVAAIAFSSNAAPYIIDMAHRPNKMIIDICDVDSEKFRNYADSASWPKSLIYRTEANRVAREERRLSLRADHVTFVSDDEKAIFAKANPDLVSKISTVSLGTDCEYFDPSRAFERPFGDGPALVFTGAMDYWPNENAVCWFADEVLPGIHKSLPDAQFVIVGSNPGPAVRKLQDRKGITVTGRVPDVRAYIAHADLAVAPMQIARGMQNKVLESMAMGKATAVTPSALTGIHATPGQNLETYDLAPDWISGCLGLLKDAARRAQLGTAARQLMLEKYSWHAQLSQYDDILKS